MKNEHSLITKVRFTISICALYVFTIGIGWYALQPAPVVQHTALAAVVKKAPTEPAEPKFILISGKPIRIVIAELGIDLPVDEGNYNSADGSWTLSENHAQYAMMTVLANNHSGNTFIYGHGTDQVFGRLGNSPPSVGSVALVYTDNGHVFSYSFQYLANVPPEDTSVFNYQGPPILTVQTCTGAVSEWRTMFHFKFEGVT